MRCKSRHLVLISLVAVAILTMSVEISSLWAQEESTESSVRLRNVSYPISELYHRNPENSRPEQPLAEFLFVQRLSEHPNDLVKLYGEWRRQLGRSLGAMRAAFESYGAVVNPTQEVPEDVREAHREYLHGSEEAYYSHKSTESFLDDFVKAGSLEAEIRDVLLNDVEDLKWEADRLAEEIWELRQQGLEYSQKKEADLSPDEYLTRLRANKLNDETELGRFEINWIDGKKFIRVIHRAFNEAFLFPVIGKIHPRSHHYAKYIASQHVDSGRTRTDKERGRDVVSSWVKKLPDGTEVIDQVRYHSRHAPWSSDFQEWKNFRADELLYMKSSEGIENRAKGMGWGFVLGVLQGSATMAVDEVFRQLGWKAESENRLDVAVFAVAFSTFWGIWQPELRKFTSRVMIGWWEQNTRRIVSTGLLFNIPVLLMIHGIYYFSLGEVAGWFHWVELLAVLTASNTLFKSVMDWVIHVDSRLDLNKHRVSISLPRFWIKTKPGGPAPEPIHVNLGIKKADLQQRLNSVRTFTYRFVQMDNAGVLFNIGGVDIRVGQIVYWMFPILEMWRSVRHAEKRESDLAPELRGKFERYIGWWATPLFTYAVPVIPLTNASKWTLQRMKSLAGFAMRGKSETRLQNSPTESTDACTDGLKSPLLKQDGKS